MADLFMDEYVVAGRAAGEFLAEYLAGLDGRRVAPASSRQEIRALVAGSLEEKGIGILQAIDEFRNRIEPNSIAISHPCYFGLVNSSPLPAAVFADFFVSSLNNNNGASHQSPAMTAVEDEVIASVCRRIRLGDGFGGMFLPGGSFANLQGILMARARFLPEWNQVGPTGIARKPVVFTSRASHFSVARAARLAGFGRENLVSIPTRGRGEMDPEALEKAILRARSDKCRPFLVVATAGSTGTGAIDDVDRIGELCRSYGLWLHLDACYGGGAFLLDEMRQDFGDIDKADSIAVDPHKWFFIPMTAAILYHRHRQVELEMFDVDASYIPNDGYVEVFRRGMPTSRRCSGFTVWMAIRAHGWETIRTAVRSNVELTRNLELQLAEQGFEVLGGGRLSIACARWSPGGLGLEESDRLQERVAAAIVDSGNAWFSTVDHDGKKWLRFNILNLHTRQGHIDRFVKLLTSTARGLSS